MNNLLFKKNLIFICFRKIRKNTRTQNEREMEDLNRNLNANPEIIVQFESNDLKQTTRLKQIDYVIVFSNSKQNAKQKDNKDNFLYNLVLNGLNLDYKVNEFEICLNNFNYQESRLILC